MAIFEVALDLSSVEEVSCFVDFTVVEDALVCAARCRDVIWRDDSSSDCAKDDEAFACSCICRRFIHADVTGPCVENSDAARTARAADAARTARAELLDAAAAAAVDSRLASLDIEEDLAYLSLSSVGSYLLPVTHFRAKRSLYVNAPGVSPLVALSPSK